MHLINFFKVVFLALLKKVFCWISGCNPDYLVQYNICAITIPIRAIEIQYTQAHFQALLFIMNSCTTTFRAGAFHAMLFRGSIE